MILQTCFSVPPRQYSNVKLRLLVQEFSLRVLEHFQEGWLRLLLKYQF